MSNENIQRRGLMLVLSSPSGAGKTTLSRRLLASDDAITMSVSCTTRAPRTGEEEGKDYFFVSSSMFTQMAQGGAFLAITTARPRSR
jgi:guanylate kinase